MPEEQIKVQEISYGNVGRCVQVGNGQIEFVATVNCGPRIIRFGFAGKHNEFCEQEGSISTYGGQRWQVRGGHRLWHSPEQMPRTYIADNDPLTCQSLADGFIFTQPVEPWVQIQKEMEVRLTESNQLTIVHRLVNQNAWPVELAVWGLTVMAPGGMEIIPQPAHDTGLLANRRLALWPYTKMNDPRVCWGERYITVRQNPAMKAAFKFGIDNQDGWAAYFNRGHLFVKQYCHHEKAQYPDFGVSYETYTNDAMLEMETLSPLTLLQPEAMLEHKEIWSLFESVELEDHGESGLDALVRRYIKHPE
ncbi:hypothetical protein P22_1606 [Propionispora sp. 2/2-37]|uniref:hypothetical protein n=1 Tax=Propionispora sp. 2/2-37 TaxID=1677858 RepID=UPI0006BB6A25|nr:hypothetical protein [Propionispora sp. 2/2-37]CUH95535.1 hypothetical protein P22_1606 [Propionispora sp. 2/2-37]